MRAIKTAGLLLQLRLRIARNSINEVRHRSKLLLFVIAAGIVLLALLVFAGSLTLLLIARQQNALPEIVARLCFTGFLLLLAGSVPFAASTLALSEDYPVLFAAPIQPEAAIAARLLDAAVSNSAQFAVIGLPMFPACAWIAGYSGWQWLLLTAAVFLYLTLPALLSGFILLVLLRLLGAARLRGAIAILNLLMGAVTCLAVVIEAQHLPIHFNAVQLMQSPAPLTAAHWPPAVWMTRLLLSSAHTGVLLQNLLWLFLANLALFAACMAAGKGLQEELGDALAATEKNAVRSLRGGEWQWLPSPLGMMASRDTRMVLRDPMLLSQLGVPVLLYLTPYMLAVQNSDPASRELLFPFAAGVVVFILYMQTSILTLSLPGMDAQAFWIILAAPQPIQRTLVAKWLVGFLFCSVTAAALILIAGISFSASPAALILCSAVILCSAAALCGLGTGIAALFPKFIHANPSLRVSNLALIAGFFASAAYTLLSVLLLAGAWWIDQNSTAGSLHKIWAILMLLLYLLLSAVCTALPIGLGAARLQQYEWAQA